MLAGRLAQHDQAVTLLGRREDVLREIKANGIDIIGADGGLSKIETSPLNSIKSIGAFDILFLCVKSWDTLEVVCKVEPLLKSSGVIVSLQNGINDGRVADGVGDNRTIGGILRMPARLVHPGQVEALSQRAKVTLGSYSKAPLFDIDVIAALLGSFAEVSTTSNLAGERWSKLADNCAGNPLLALTGYSMGELLSNKKGRQVSYGVLRELLNVAIAEGVAVEDIFGLAPCVWNSNKTADRKVCDAALLELGQLKSGQRSSMVFDLVAGRRTEIDFLNGEICTRAKGHQLNVPINLRIVEMIHEMETGKRKASISNIEELFGLLEPKHKIENIGEDNG
ncbi:MAG: 2-dehydropantoate 2-reductase [Rhodospirillaceae bacterium]|nr:2-dehydropantoate 2-reductase [Rhodospirillaceae bacterium]